MVVGPSMENSKLTMSSPVYGDSPAVKDGGSGGDGMGAFASSRGARKHILSCRIGGHTIQKCTSPKKKALDPLRYMPDRTSYFALFTVIVQFEDHAGEHQVYRTYKQFGTLHTKLLKKFPKSKLPKEIPSMRKKRYDNEYIEQKSQELNEYFEQLLELPEVKQCRILREFLEDSQLSDDSDDEDSLPSKVLEGLPGTIVTVRAGQSFSVSLNMKHADDVASWQFTTKKHNIGFSATFAGQTVRVYSREESQAKPIKGSYRCTEPGTLTLDWDNTYTWSKTKVLIYWAEVEPCRVVNAIGDELNGSTGSSHVVSDATPMIDGRRSGYIAQSRSPSLYPRQIMNSSISLITKPFTSGKNKQAQVKSGSLIIERNVKFRGRNWYRKWFVLDTRKGLLRYYDSEASARKGLSLEKLTLSSKNASLAITSSTEAAPTPYLFMVRARKRCWKICTSSQAEYNEWEHAISTAILIAQLRRRGKNRATSTDGGEKSDMDNVLAALEDQDSDEDDDEEDEEDAKEGEEEEDESDEEQLSDCAPSKPSVSTPPPLVPTQEGLLDVLQPVIREPPSLPVPATRVVATTKTERPPRAPTRAVTAWYPYIQQLQSISIAKKIIFVIWINGLIYAIRASVDMVIASMALVINGYLVIHALENSQMVSKRKKDA